MKISEGIVPPNAVEFEKVVVGVMLIDKSGLEKAVAVLGDDSAVFYDPRNQTIYRSILNLKSNNHPVDIMTVIQNLKKN